MSTIAEFRLPATELALANTLESVSDATIELEPSISRTDPCLLVTDVSPADVEEQFESDPSIRSFDRLVDTHDGSLYDVIYAANARQISDEVRSDGGLLLEAIGSNGAWQVRMRFRSREELCHTHDRLVDNGLQVDLQRVTRQTSTSMSHTRLTPEQQEALAAAFEHGYFEIPRRISMEELASELGISHQALSERFRRAYETLVDAELQPAAERSRSSRS